MLFRSGSVGSVLAAFWLCSGTVLAPFWLHSGSVLAAFWLRSGSVLAPLAPFWICWLRSGSVGALFPVDFLVPFFLSRKKERKRGSPGGGHAIRPRRRMFREGRPSSLRLHFELHFGVILGAKLATILFFGRPGGQHRLTKERLNSCTILQGHGTRMSHT